MTVNKSNIIWINKEVIPLKDGLAVAEAQLVVAQVELAEAQKTLDDKQLELDTVQAQFDATMKKKQALLMTLKN